MPRNVNDSAIIKAKIANALRKRRTVMGYQQKWVAHSIGVSPVTYSNYENVKSTKIPGLRQLMALSSCLDISLDEIMTGEVTSRITLNTKEEKLLAIFRALKGEHQELLLRLASTFGQP